MEDKNVEATSWRRFFKKQFSQTKIFTCRCCVWRFKIVDVFDKYSPVATSQKPQKKNFDISLYRKQRDSRRDRRTLVPFVFSPLLSRRNREPTNEPKKKIEKTDEMQNKGRNDVSALPCLLATENGIGSSLTTKTSRKHRGDVFSKGNLHKQ